MHDKFNYPKIHYQFYRKGRKENINLNNHRNNYRYHMSNQQNKEMSNQINNTMIDSTMVNQNSNDLQHKKDIKKKIMLGDLIVKARLDYLYPKDAEVIYGMLLTNKRLIALKPDFIEQWREIGKGLKKKDLKENTDK